MSSITKQPNGKWRAFVRKNGQDKTKVFTLKRDAQAWANNLEAQREHSIATGYEQIPNDLTVRSVNEKVLRSLKQRASSRDDQQACRKLT